MKKELEDSLRHMQANPTTGTPHNQQLISTQVETIFAIDSLQEEISKLKTTIVSLDSQNEKLNKTNIRLQWSMVGLTVATIILSIITLFKH